MWQASAWPEANSSPYRVTSPAGPPSKYALSIDLTFAIFKRHPQLGKGERALGIMAAEQKAVLAGRSAAVGQQKMYAGEYRRILYS
ncbi:MAG: hypothetical protein TUN42_02570 [Dehalogenimonas sp.]